LRGRDVGAFDAIIVAGSVHQKRHQESLVAFALAHLADLEAKPSAFLSVSLSAALKDGEQDCVDYVEDFVEKSGWRPSNLLMVPGAVRYSEYDFFMEQIIRHVVIQGRESKDFKEDYELTDWEALGTFVDEFIDKAGA
ncbi:MAG: flavodoxin domain-containing protein, partial [Hyphomicrobiales bacterium]